MQGVSSRLARMVILVALRGVAVVVVAAVCLGRRRGDIRPGPQRLCEWPGVLDVVGLLQGGLLVGWVWVRDVVVVL